MAALQGHRARKRFGQNFLQDSGIIRRIVHAIRPQPEDALVEIGPGMGAITTLLLQHCPQLDVIELDRDLIPGLRTQFFNQPGFTIHQADALKFDFCGLQKDQRRLRIVGNLPYNISTPLIFHLLSFEGLIQDMHFMLQKEVVDRLAAQPGTAQWGRLSVMAQYLCRVEALFDVPPECFVPRPKVNSAIVRLTPHREIQQPVKAIKQLEETLRTAFSQRRKTLRNNFKGRLTDTDWQGLEIDPSRRPETLSLSEFVQLSNWQS